MILHKRWGEVVRLGNFLFKYASLLGISKKYETEFYVPTHYMFDYFKNKPMIDGGINPDLEIYEKSHSYDPENFIAFHICHRVIDKSIRRRNIVARLSCCIIVQICDRVKRYI